MRACALLVVLCSGVVLADDALTVAVASNFTRAAAELAQAFDAETGIDIRFVPGSTGKLYAQIVNGAPFDVLLAADAERPRLLEESGHAVAGSRFTYAVGALILWSLAFEDCYAALADVRYEHIAIANPLTAPYGKAAREFLVAEGVWETAEQRAVYGENISQTLQFVATGNAPLGLVSRSQVIDAVGQRGGCAWSVPTASHAPIEQQAVLLRPGGELAMRFAEFLQSRKAREIIERHGYEVAP